jgi:hypothetical protein
MIIMGLTNNQRIISAIALLESYGYTVTKKKNYPNLVGKWAVFRQDGMPQILHGKVVNISEDGYCTIKCKNGCIRCTHVEDAIEFCDDKKSCYKIN